MPYSDLEKRRAYAKEYRSRPESKKKMLAAYASEEYRSKKSLYMNEYRKRPEAIEKRKRFLDELRKSPAFKLEYRLRARTRHALNYQGVKREEKTFSTLGCGQEEFRSHIARLFKPGMNWENMSEWHVDHIIPCSKFDLSDPLQRRRCFHYSNLMPLWRRDNLKKSASIPPCDGCGFPLPPIGDRIILFGLKIGTNPIIQFLHLCDHKCLTSFVVKASNRPTIIAPANGN